MPNTFSSFNKEKRFIDFSNSIQFCNLCPRMLHRNKVLSELNGNLNSEVIFIAEAPGRLGADKTGIPLYGDQTGTNFQKLLDSIGWERREVFITNAVLCNPRNNEGNNDTPNSTEIKNCSVFLNMIINLIKPKIIVTLGKTALESLSHIKKHELTLKSDASYLRNWNGFLLFPLYHPGPRALIHRPINLQIKDFQKLAEAFSPYPELTLVAEQQQPYLIRQKAINFSYDVLEETILFIISQIKELSFFKVTKLLYMCDLLSIERYNYSLTGATYLRQKEGPWLPKLKQIINKFNGEIIKLYFDNKKPLVKTLNIRVDYSQLSSEKLSIINEVLKQYGSLTDRGIKIAAYRTKPMQYILDKEKHQFNMLNKPVIQGNKTIIEIDK